MMPYYMFPENATVQDLAHQINSLIDRGFGASRIEVRSRLSGLPRIIGLIEHKPGDPVILYPIPDVVAQRSAEDEEKATGE